MSHGSSLPLPTPGTSSLLHINPSPCSPPSRTPSTTEPIASTTAGMAPIRVTSLSRFDDIVKRHGPQRVEIVSLSPAESDTYVAYLAELTDTHGWEAVNVGLVGYLSFIHRELLLLEAVKLPRFYWRAGEQNATQNLREDAQFVANLANMISASARPPIQEVCNRIIDLADTVDGMDEALNPRWVRNDWLMNEIARAQQDIKALRFRALSL
ncbi:hypothetical protein ACP70R_005909 [Stipagrostis hirtigluma subsp. patula]